MKMGIYRFCCGCGKAVEILRSESAKVSSRKLEVACGECYPIAFGEKVRVDVRNWLDNMASE